MSQTTFSILEAVLISSRSEGNDVEIDIRSNLVEFQIFEHLAKALYRCYDYFCR